jgi:hypothetical protein
MNNRPTIKERVLNWIIPTILTGLIAILAGGVQVSLRTNQQNTEVLLQELNKVRIERQQLNEQLYQERKRNADRPQPIR